MSSIHQQIYTYFSIHQCPLWVESDKHDLLFS